MSNKSSDGLHRLIKSLTKPEKRYFKVYASRHVIGEVNNYQVLFDAIDKQKEYDEGKLMVKFKDEAFTNRFSITKSRLYFSILKSLDSFHSSSSIEAQLKRQLHWAEILYKKSLYDQSLKVLRSAKKVAEKHQKITTLIEINKWEKSIIEKDNYEGYKKEALMEILDTDQKLVNRLVIFNNLWNIKSRIFKALFVKGKARNAEELAKFKKIIDEVVHENTEHEMIAENEYLLNHIYSAYYFGVGDYAQCYPYLQKNLSLIEQKPQLFIEEPSIFLSVLTNAIYVGTQLKKFDEAHESLKKLREMPEQLKENATEDIDMRVFSISYSTELALYAQQGQFEKGVALLPEIEEGILKYEGKLSSVRKAFFYFNIAVVYFGLGQYNEALKWINQLLNNIEIDKSQDIHCMGQILNLVIHMELGNKSLLPYTMRSTQRYLETRNKVFKFETIFLKFINESIKKRPEFTEQKLYTTLLKDLEILNADNLERNVFEYFNFLAWAKSKVAERSFVEEVQSTV